MAVVGGGGGAAVPALWPRLAAARQPRAARELLWRCLRGPLAAGGGADEDDEAEDGRRSSFQAMAATVEPCRRRCGPGPARRRRRRQRLVREGRPEVGAMASSARYI